MKVLRLSWQVWTTSEESNLTQNQETADWSAQQNSYHNRGLLADNVATNANTYNYHRPNFTPISDQCRSRSIKKGPTVLSFEPWILLVQCIDINNKEEATSLISQNGSSRNIIPSLPMAYKTISESNNGCRSFISKPIQENNDTLSYRIQDNSHSFYSILQETDIAIWLYSSDLPEARQDNDLNR